MTDFLDAQAAEWTRYTAEHASHESVSGPGSTLAFTAPLRAWLPGIFSRYQIRTILDAACGDWAWMSTVNLTGITYTGWDNEPNVVARNQNKYPQHVFHVVNLLTIDRLPAVDLIIARDIFIHLPNDEVVTLLKKFAASGSRYLLTTNFRGATNDPADPHDAEGYFYRAVDLEVEPFNLTGRIDHIAEPGREPGREMLLVQL